MTMIVNTYKHPMTFEEYLLSESVEPISTDYGCNPRLFNNSKIITMGNLIVSFFLYNNILYFVQKNIFTGEIGFAKANNIPNTTKELEDLIFDVKPVKSSDGLGVFNRSFYVFIKLMAKYKTNKNLFFTPANTDLERLYKVLIRSKFFNNQLHKLGYSSLYFDAGRYRSDYIN
jgi:hypothetical protein